IFSVLAIARPEAILGALGFLVLWLFAPLSAAWISRAAPTQTLHLTQKDEKYLHLLARKTWLFFERFVNAENHWLPLDNVQEFPIPVMARRTSPTNIGLSLLANLSAYDFSFISSSRLLERCSLCIDTMQRLPRFQGHFYNWYNTEDLQPLLPQYVSTVDSGNLAGHMLILRAGLSSLPSEPIFRWSYFGALKDTYHILCSHLTEQNVKSIASLGIALDQACMRESNDLLIAHRALIDIRDLCVNLADLLPDTSGNQTDDVVQVWRDALIEQSQDLLTDLEHRCPWLHKSHLLSHERIQAFSELSVIPSHQALVQLHEDFLAHIDQFQQSENTASSKASNDFSGGLRSEFEVATILSETEQSQAQAQFNQFILHVHQLTLLASARASTQLLAIKALCAKIDELSDMEYDFLYNRTSHLLAIGYNVTERRLDSGAYDLLASEARLATFVGIAQNKLPQESWFALGRQLTIANGEPILLSWSGSMFEYLMPLLVMPDFKHTLLHQTYHAAVQRQIDYGKERQIPWGISESAY
ncbi:MAG: hypothetical protein K2X81_23095, partial [Candidatus Obscuribacterales bacterium]|nr:hypothetical protein [Candidatus Obscuribacterales bacterium]